MTNDYEDDVVLRQEFFEPNNWVYPILMQLDLLQKTYLAEIEVDSNYVAKRLTDPTPKGCFKVAVPKIDFLGRINCLKDPYFEIGVLIEQVCVLLNEQRKGKFTHYRKDQLSPNRISCVKKLVNRRKKLEFDVPGDVLILDVSLGGHYAGWTPRRAREEIAFHDNQFALSSVDLGWILLLNPNRFRHCDDLSVDSVMEEYFSEDRSWECVLFFYFRGGKLEFGYRWGRRAYMDSGAAIAIAPELETRN